MDVRYTVEQDRAQLQGASLADNPMLEEALRQVEARFLAAMPEEVLNHAGRFWGELTMMYWFYLDTLRENNKRHLPELSFKKFYFLLVEAARALRSRYPSSEDRAAFFQQMVDWRAKVPVRGGILLNSKLDKVLVVQTYKRKAWTFPRGKIDEGESDVQCAIREVLEETSLDLSELAQELAKGRPELEPEFIEADIYDIGLPVRLYLFRGVSEQAPLRPSKKKEVRSISWMPVADLPGWGRGRKGEVQQGVRFVDVEPFVPPLRRWLEASSGQPAPGGGGGPDAPRGRAMQNGAGAGAARRSPSPEPGLHTGARVRAAAAAAISLEVRHIAMPLLGKFEPDLVQVLSAFDRGCRDEQPQARKKAARRRGQAT